MLETTCHQCGVVFHAQRRTAKFCDDACRKANHETTRKGNRKREPQNRSTSRAQARREDEFFDRHMQMCETYYGLTPKDRPEYLLKLIAEAREGNWVIRRVLTNYVLLRPHELRPKVVHWRSSKNYPTISQEANMFCKRHFGYGIACVIDNTKLGPLPDPVRRDEEAAEREYQEQLLAIQKRILPGLAERPHHVVKAVVHSIVATRGPRLPEEFDVR